MRKMESFLKFRVVLIHTDLLLTHRVRGKFALESTGWGSLAGVAEFAHIPQGFGRQVRDIFGEI